MASIKVYSEKMKQWYSCDLIMILSELNISEEVYTHHFEGILFNGKRNFGFVGKDNRPHLRKCLWTLEHDGLIENINIGLNIYKWKITERGRNYLIKSS